MDEKNSEDSQNWTKPQTESNLAVRGIFGIQLFPNWTVGALIRRGRLLEEGGGAGGGAISEIYGNSIASFYLFSDYDVIPPITPYTPPSR